MTPDPTPAVPPKPEYLAIPYKPGLAYLQRARLDSASDNPLTVQEEVIIHLFGECERLAAKLAWLRAPVARERPLTLLDPDAEILANFDPDAASAREHIECSIDVAHHWMTEVLGDYCEPADEDDLRGKCELLRLRCESASKQLAELRAPVAPAEALKRIEGCQHTLERMAYWSKEGACPICLTATCGMLRDEVARLKEEARAKDAELAGLKDEVDYLVHRRATLAADKVQLGIDLAAALAVAGPAAGATELQTE